MEISQEWFNEFFSNVDANDLLKRRESNTIEFKQEFNWSNKEFRSNIACTSAAFSNNVGGVIIFGIADKPHTIIGVEGFDDIDEANIALWFNEHFSPSINFSKHTFSYNSITIGCIQIYESKTKPIVCIKDSSKTTDSTIYFRYSAMSSRIKSGDLLYLFNQAKQEVSDKWLSMISKIATIGIGNIGLMNTSSGEITSNGNQTYLLDSSIIDQIKFLDQYSEAVEGAPAVKIIGNIEQTATVIEKTRTLYEEDLYKSFLTETMSVPAVEYISLIIRQNSPTYPIYWFLNLENIPVHDRGNYLLAINTRSKNKDKVMNRLLNDFVIKSKHGKFTLNETPLGLRRKAYYEKICNQESIKISTEAEAKELFESIFSLQKEKFDILFLKKQLSIVYDDFYPFRKDAINSLMRWALTYLDNISYKDKDSLQ